MSVPVNCLCDANQHLGQSVHPVFEHYHGDGHAHRAVEPDSATLSLPMESSGPTLVASEHGSFLGVAVDGLVFGRANFWLALGFFPLLTLLPSAHRAYAAALLAPPTGPPRPRALFS
jgi:hypothetical protein